VPAVRERFSGWEIRGGTTRRVLLIGNYAIKVPRIGYGWQAILKGLLANMQEKMFSATEWPELCPVLWYVPGGFLIVMRRARPLSDKEWEGFRHDEFVDKGDYIVPVEDKYGSFGVLDGRVVAVDYGP
jgi:hypothetical protein